MKTLWIPKRKLDWVLAFTLVIIGVCGGKPVSAQQATISVTGPGTLNQAGALYVLANNISAAGTAFTVSASGITLDLNGHTITYNTAASSSSVYGVKLAAIALDSRGLKLRNGTITQGTGSSSYSHAMDFSGAAANNVEISNITTNVRGSSCEAIYLTQGSNVNVHHNRFNSTVTSIGTRYNYDGFAARFSNVSGLTFADNTIAGGHGGTAVAGCSNIAILRNDFSHRNLGGNGYGVLTWDAHGGSISNNNIHTSDGLGILVDNDTQNLDVSFNTIDVRMVPKDEGVNAWGIKCRTWNTTANPYGLKVHDNTITATTGDGLQTNAAGLGIYSAKAGMNSEYYNNTITVITTSATHGAHGIKVAGDAATNTGTKVYNNTVTSNNINLWISTEDGHGADGILFTNNTFIKGANPVNYHTIRDGNWRWASQNHVLLGNKTQNGASMSDVQLVGSDPPGDYTYSFFLKWNVEVTVKDAAGNLVSGATVTAASKVGKEQVSGITDAQGRVVLPVTQYRRSGTTYPATSVYDTYGPHTLTVSKSGYPTTSQDISVTDNQSLGITLSGGTATPTLSISLAVNKTQAAPGETVTYTITYANTGSASASSVSIVDTLPNEVTYVAGSTRLNGQVVSPDPYSSGRILVTIGTLSAGQQGTITFQATVK